MSPCCARACARAPAADAAFPRSAQLKPRRTGTTTSLYCERPPRDPAPSVASLLTPASVAARASEETDSDAGVRPASLRASAPPLGALSHGPLCSLVRLQ